MNFKWLIYIIYAKSYSIKESWYGFDYYSDMWWSIRYQKLWPVIQGQISRDCAVIMFVTKQWPIQQVTIFKNCLCWDWEHYNNYCPVPKKWYTPFYVWLINGIRRRREYVTCWLLDHAWFSHLLATHWLCIVIILIVVQITDYDGELL